MLSGVKRFFVEPRWNIARSAFLGFIVGVFAAFVIWHESTVASVLFIAVVSALGAAAGRGAVHRDS